MIKGKWKALLILNYTSAVIWLLMLLIFVLMFWQARQGGPEVKSNAVIVGIGGGILLLFNIFYIYILKTYYPSRKLTGTLKFLYIVGLIFLGGITLIFLFTLIFSIYGLSLHNNGVNDTNALAIVVLLFVFSVICLMLLIWQAQLMSFLEENYASELKSVINSIGVDENNSA